MEQICMIIALLSIVLLGILCPILGRYGEKETIRQKVKKININSNYILKFDKLYDELCAEDFSELKRLSNKVKFCLYSIIYLFIICMLFFIIAIFVDAFSSLIVMIGSFFAMYILCIPKLYRLEKLTEQYAYEYKKNILVKFINLIDDTLIFKDISENQKSVQELYEEVNFFNEVYSFFKADDYICGEINNRLFRLADVVIYNNTKNGRNRGRIFVFKGLFGVLNLKNNIPAEIQIQKKKNNLIDNIRLKNFDYKKFENDVYIYSNDNTLMDKVASAGIIQLVNDYFESFGIEVEIILKNSKSYMRFSGKDMFEPLIYGDVLDKEALYFYYCSLILIMNLIGKVEQAVDNMHL